jgi:prepilin-type N-terminal cleavage/methylation domain-containing protein
MDRDDGFTLTELLAGLLVASLLIAGVVDIIRQYAATTQRIRVVSAELRSRVLVDGLLAQLSRADPGSVVLTETDLQATIGAEPVAARLLRANDGTTFAWSGPGLIRTIALPPGMRFTNPRPGLIVLGSGQETPPLASVEARRTQVYDCQFDTVSLTCRQ